MAGNAPFFFPLLASALSMDPPTEYTTFIEVSEAVIGYIVAVGLPIAVIMILYAGLLYMTSGGNEQKITSARSALIWGLIGIAVLLIGEGFVTIVCNTLDNPQGC